MKLNINIVGLTHNDIEEDLKNGDYNPLLYRFKKSADEDAASFKSRIRSEVDFTLSQCIYNLSQAIEFCEREDPVLKNIVNQGLSMKQFMVLYPEEFKKQRDIMQKNSDSNLT